MGRELEKKFSGKHVVFIAQRRILPKPTRKANKLKQKRPRSRTLLAVHNSIRDTWFTQLRLLERGSRSGLTDLVSLRFTWTRPSRPILNTRQTPLPMSTRS